VVFTGEEGYAPVDDAELNQCAVYKTVVHGKHGVSHCVDQNPTNEIGYGGEGLDDPAVGKASDFRKEDGEDHGERGSNYPEEAHGEGVAQYPGNILEGVFILDDDGEVIETGEVMWPDGETGLVVIEGILPAVGGGRRRGR
jgi:hypothetical protein